MGITLNQLREYMKTQAQEDKKKKSIRVTGATLDETLENASIELGIPVKKVEW